MKDIKGIKGTYHIAALIAEGEHEHQDFKYAVNDARKIARSISAFANRDGGRLLIGVRDNGSIAGVRSEEDIYVVEQAAQMCCTPPQEIAVRAYRVEGGLTVFKVEIARASLRPVRVREADGSLKAYFRVADENISAPPLMELAWERALSPSPSGFALTPQGRMLLSAAATAEGVTLEEFMFSAHMSHAAASDLAASCYALGLIDFRYDGQRFSMVAVEP